MTEGNNKTKRLQKKFVREVYREEEGLECNERKTVHTCEYQQAEQQQNWEP